MATMTCDYQTNTWLPAMLECEQLSAGAWLIRC